MCKIPSSRLQRKIKLGVSIHVHFRREIGKSLFFLVSLLPLCCMLYAFTGGIEMMIFYTHWPCFHQRQLHLSGIQYSSFWLTVRFSSIYVPLLHCFYVLFMLDIFISLLDRDMKCVLIARVW